MRAGTKIAAGIATTAAVAVLGGAAYGVLGYDSTGHTTRTPGATTTESVATPTEPPSATPTEPASPQPETAQPDTGQPSAEPTVEPEPVKPLLAPGDTGEQVRELQARLSQIGWFTPPVTGSFDDATRSSVAGFQAKRGFDATGAVDRRSWKALLGMTRKATHAELFNEPGPTLFGPGASGPAVREIQARLRQIGWFFGDVVDSYGPTTTEAVSGFQDKRGVAATGAVDQRTLDLLEGMTTEPTADELANRKPDPAEGAALDSRCTTGRALCIDKSTRSLRWVVDGKVLLSLDVRFGSEYTPTREGLFHVGWKDADHISGEYGSSMPYSLFFSGGQAVHYSSDFAARGYAGASHGCVNVRDYDALASLFGQVRVGDKVVVYWS